MTQPSAEKNQVTLEDALKIAHANLQSGNLYVAEATFNDILKTVEDHPEALFGLGLVSYYKRACGDAVYFYEKSLASNPESPVCYNALAIALSEMGRVKEALAACDKALALKPDFFEVLSNQSNAYRLAGDPMKAKETAQKAIEINADYPQSYINLGTALIDLKDENGAEEAFKKAILLNGNISFSYINLGNLYRDQGKIKDSEEMCRKAVAKDPHNPLAHNNLGNALYDQGHFEEAEKEYREATRLKPDYFEAHNNLCIALMALLRMDEAASAAQYAITFKNDFTDAYINLAVVQKELGYLDQAKQAAQQAIKLAPDLALGHATLAEILFREDRYEEAEIVLKKAMKLEPGSARLHLSLADALEHSNRLAEAIDVIDAGIQHNPEVPELYQKKANAYFMFNRLDEAVEAIDICLELNPDYLPAFATKSEILQSLGDMDQARALCEEGLNRETKLPSLYFALSKVKKFESEDDQYLQEMLAIEENAGEKLGKPQHAMLCFSIYKAWQDLKQYDKAFEALKKGNDLKRATVPLNEDTQLQTFNKMKARYTPENMKVFDGKGCESEMPIFILGMPRSGTTLTEQILASHPDVFGAGELPELLEARRKFPEMSPQNAKDMGQAYVDRVQALAPDYKFITDKMPGNFMQIPQIFATMPNAKIIHTMRSPVDTCLSCYKQLFARGQYWSYNLEELGRYYNAYADIMKHYNEIFPGKILNIHYEDTVSNVEAQVKTILDFVGLEWNDACLEPHKSKRPILTASKGQVRKPIYKTSVNAADIYKEQLKPLTDILADISN